MDKLERKIPKGCPVLGGSSKVKIVKTAFIRTCKAKQFPKRSKKSISIYTSICSYGLVACKHCPIGSEVNSGKFRRPVPGQIEFIHPYDLIQQSE